MEEKNQKSANCRYIRNLHSTTFSSECEIEGGVKRFIALHRCYNLGTLGKVTFAQSDIVAYGIRNFEGYFKNGRR